MTSSPVEIGAILADKYKVERVLGVGGMGVVVAALHLHLNQRVALKFLLPEVLDNAEVVERFAREARAAAKIQSEHVARVIDVGHLPTGSPYMVMEYLEGSDLAAELVARGRLELVDVVTYVLQACEAIAEAHSTGIVHRDLKPANLFLARRADRSSMIKVLDFGISKATTGVDAALTKTSSIIGSPFYMSPEQLTSPKSVDARSDIWSLGVVLHELLIGRTPFIGETMPAVVAMILSTPPPSLRDTRPDLPAEIDAIVVRCLQRAQADRFADVAELARALAPFGTSEAHVSVERITRVLGGVAPASGAEPRPSVPEGASGPAAPMAATAGAWHHASRQAPATRRSHRASLRVGAVAAGGLFVGLALVFLRARPTVATAPSSGGARESAAPAKTLARPAVPSAAPALPASAPSAAPASATGSHAPAPAAPPGSARPGAPAPPSPRGKPAGKPGHHAPAAPAHAASAASASSPDVEPEHPATPAPTPANEPAPAPTPEAPSAPPASHDPT